MESKKKRLTLPKLSLWQWVCIALALAILTVILCFLFGRKGKTQDNTASTSQRIIAINESDWDAVSTNSEDGTKVSAKTIEDGLKNMGVLITQEYLFTEVIRYEKDGKFLWLFDATSSVLLSYEGTIGAGVDFGKIKVSMDKAANTITVSMPVPEIQYTNIDPKKTIVYSETNGLGNKLTSEDYNKALVELETVVNQKAVDRGVLQKAEENAQKMIRSFITGLVGNGYEFVFNTIA